MIGVEREHYVNKTELKSLYALDNNLIELLGLPDKTEPNARPTALLTQLWRIKRVEEMLREHHDEHQSVVNKKRKIHPDMANILRRLGISFDENKIVKQEVKQEED
ncbi:MAG: hypothetical protein P4L33_15365 [Capsulimonadaceae bacterium]|nr:hypothetical protein [Capsulimonadaceae bacterium]